MDEPRIVLGVLGAIALAYFAAVWCISSKVVGTKRADKHLEAKLGCASDQYTKTGTD
jgi:hypothetical protein